ncbi:hypothetical protein K1719_010501 [Acacia pycnantha]|nr:hypothetical protein K1719_010501 [Acacia pycnantha]
MGTRRNDEAARNSWKSHPRIGQIKVVGKKRLVEESNIPKLNYIKAFLREAFRLHPIAPLNIPHVAVRDTVVSNYFIPKSNHVLLSREGLRRNPKVWEEPLKFKPE